MIRISSTIAMLFIIMVATSFVSACDWEDSCQDKLYGTLVNGQKKCWKDLGRCNKAARKGKNWRHLRPATHSLCKYDYWGCVMDLDALYLNRVDDYVDDDKCCDSDDNYRDHWDDYTNAGNPWD